MSPSPDLPASGAEPPIAPTSTPNLAAAQPKPSAPRSILAFLGGQPRPNPLDLNPNSAKRRKKNDETPVSATQSQTQGRIVLKPANGAAWAVERTSEEGKDTEAGEVAVKGKGKSKGKRGGGEEDEMKDMGKRTKAAQRGRGGKRPTASKRKDGKKGAGQLDLKASQDSEDGSEEADGPISMMDKLSKSPRKKRGRPPKPKSPSEAGPSRKSTPSTSGNRAASPSIPNIRSSSPNDIEVTGGSDNGNVRRLKPPFSRANTSSTVDLRGQSHKDAIDVEQSLPKPGPKKHVFASDVSKPAHSFFSRKPDIPSGAAASQIAELVNNSPTEMQPKAPDLKAATGISATAPSKKVHNFFQPARNDLMSKAIKTGWGHGVKEGEEWLPPWPGQEWPAHSGMPEVTTEAGPSRPRRQAPCAPSPTSDETFWSSFLSQVEFSDNIDTPKRKRINYKNGRESLCDQFRPRAVSQVLGNVTEATYLRDWLSALVIGNGDGSGPRVIRRVPKRRLDLDDWIVDDIGEFGDSQIEEEEELPEPYDEPELPLGQRPTSYPPLSAWLTNTILLSGPSGSGKSAAVYAAAAELGWEVFEVYPGIGKRTGGNLMSLVGDVGKNHMVGKAREAEASKPSPAGLKTFFGSAKTVEPDDTPLGSQGEPIEIDDAHPERRATPPPRLRNPSVPSTPFRDDTKFRQSLILLEEVDILFDEEATFWPAVISLIAESKRPVVMTCNDPEQVMLSALPLQAILQFNPPSRELAIPHLTSLCDKLGLDRDEAYVADLYDRNVVQCPPVLSAPGPPNGNEWLPAFDLRRAITQLQLERGVPISKLHEVNDDHHQDLESAVKRAEVISYTDSHLSQRTWATMEMSEVDRYQPTLDDQLGVRTLLKPELPDHIPILPAYDRTTEISNFLLDEVGGSSARDELFTDQIHYTRSLLPLLDPVIPLSSRLLPHPILFTEYMPTIQNLVQIDDIGQAEWDASKAAGEDLRNLKTGRPVRLTTWLHQDFVRALPLEEGALEIARREMRYE